MKTNLIRLAENLKEKLFGFGIKFNNYDYTSIPKELLLEEEPEEMLPYHHKNSAKDKKKTVICNYEEDNETYGRLNRLDKISDSCSEFMGIVGFDLSPCIYWDINSQAFNILLSQMITIYVAIKGNIKILPNYRIGALETIKSLRSYPEGSNFCVGSYGCSRKVTDFSVSQFNAKVIYTRPKKLYFYGKILPPYKKFLDEINLPYRRYDTYRETYFKTKGDKQTK